MTRYPITTWKKPNVILLLSALLLIGFYSLAQQSTVGGGGGGGGGVTNSQYVNTLWVDSYYGNNTTAQTNSSTYPYRTLAAAITNLNHRTVIRIMPGYYEEPAFVRTTESQNTNGAPLRTRHGLTNIMIECIGRPTIKFTNQGTALVLWSVTNAIIRGGLWIGTRTNYADVAHLDNRFLANYGTSDNVTYDDVWITGTEGFGIFFGGFAESLTHRATVRNSRIWDVGGTNWSANSNLQEGGYLEIGGNDSVIENCWFSRGARGIEGYVSGVSMSRAIIRNCVFEGTYSRAIFFDSTQYSDVIVENNYIIGNPAFTRGVDGDWAIKLQAAKNSIVRNNVVSNEFYGISVERGNSVLETENARIEGNSLFNYLVGVNLGAVGGGASHGNQVIGNLFRWGTNQAIRVTGTNNWIEGNSFEDASDDDIIKFYTSTHTATNNWIVRNRFRDTTHGRSTAAIDLHNGSGTNMGTVIIDNVFQNIANHVDDSGAVGTVYRTIGTNGWTGIGMETPLGAMDVAGTNRVNALHFRANMATNTIPWVNAGTNVEALTIGANLTLTAGTLAASGGAASTNWETAATGFLTAGGVAVTNASVFRGGVSNQSWTVTAGPVTNNSPIRNLSSTYTVGNVTNENNFRIEGDISQNNASAAELGLITAPRVTVTNTVQLLERNGGVDAVILQAPVSLAASRTFVLPATNGLAGQVLQEDGSGNLSWVTSSGAGFTGTRIGQRQITDLTGTPFICDNSNCVVFGTDMTAAATIYPGWQSSAVSGGIIGILGAETNKVGINRFRIYNTNVLSLCLWRFSAVGSAQLTLGRQNETWVESNVSFNTTNFQGGLTNTFAAVIGCIEGFTAVYPTDGLFWQYTSNSLYWEAVYSIASVRTTNTTTVLVTADTTWVPLGIYVSPTTNVSWYINGTNYLTVDLKSGLPASVGWQPGFKIYSLVANPTAGAVIQEHDLLVDYTYGYSRSLRPAFE